MSKKSKASAAEEASVAQAKVFLAGLDNLRPDPSPAPAPEEANQPTTSLHSPKPIKAGCLGTTKAGNPCRMATGSDGLCAQHSPRFTPEQRSAWGRRGAMSNIRKQALAAVEAIKATMPEALEPPKEILHVDGPSYATLATTRAYLERMSVKVQHNELAPSQATAIAQFASLAIRLAETQIEADLVALEVEAAAQAPGQPKVINPAAPRTRS